MAMLFTKAQNGAASSSDFALVVKMGESSTTTVSKQSRGDRDRQSGVVLVVGKMPLNINRDLRIAKNRISNHNRIIVGR